MEEEQRRRRTAGAAMGLGVKLRKTLGHILKDEVGSGGVEGGAGGCSSPFISTSATEMLRQPPTKMPSEIVG